MDLFISEINFFKGYHYQSDGIDLKWSVDGLVVGEGMDSCMMDGTVYSGGSVIPWSALHSGTLTFTSRDQEIPVTLKKPADEEVLIRFLQRPGFPGDVRLSAYQAFFSDRYQKLKLEETLSEAFFSTVLDAYERIGLGTNNPSVQSQVRRWKDLFLRYLTGEMINVDPDENPGRLSKTVARIKNLSEEA